MDGGREGEVGDEGVEVGGVDVGGDGEEVGGVDVGNEAVEDGSVLVGGDEDGKGEGEVEEPVDMDCEGEEEGGRLGDMETTELIQPQELQCSRDVRYSTVSWCISVTRTSPVAWDTFNATGFCDAMRR